jgi:hypothetical protein
VLRPACPNWRVISRDPVEKASTPTKISPTRHAVTVRYEATDQLTFLISRSSGPKSTSSGMKLALMSTMCSTRWRSSLTGSILGQRIGRKQSQSRRLRWTWEHCRYRSIAPRRSTRPCCKASFLRAAPPSGGRGHDRILRALPARLSQRQHSTGSASGIRTFTKRLDFARVTCSQHAHRHSQGSTRWVIPVIEMLKDQLEWST